jgi:hypothetical protein
MGDKLEKTDAEPEAKKKKKPLDRYPERLHETVSH